MKRIIYRQTQEIDGVRYCVCHFCTQEKQVWDTFRSWYGIKPSERGKLFRESLSPGDLKDDLRTNYYEMPCCQQCAEKQQVA